jgi:hypothetical protein
VSGSFLTPLAALVALVGIVPLAVFARRERRAAQVRATLGLAALPVRARVPVVVALVAVPALAGLAAAQPVLDLTRERHERLDAEAYVVVDISRSMLASSGVGSPTRFERARTLAAALQAGIPEIPLGLASITDRTLPNLFPTTDAAVFSAALERSIAIEHPPPQFWFAERATDLNSLAAVTERSFFAPEAEKRLLVVLTDGETREPPQPLVSALAEPPGVALVLVPIWGEGERIYEAGAPEPGYEPDPEGPETLRHIASETGGRVVAEDRPEALVAAAREALGEGPTRVVAREGHELALMPWATALALVPLALLLWRRNL